MSWLFSQALVAAYSADTCSDGAASAPSSTTLMPRAYCSHDKMTAVSRLSRFGMTFAPLTEDRGAELLTWYLAGFPVRTSAQQEKAQESQESAADCGKKWRALSVKYDRATSSWKTHRCLFPEDLSPSLVTLPKWGMMLAGELSERSTPVHRISEIGVGLWPTVRSSDGERGGRGDLIQAIRGNPNSHYKMWPTPTKADGMGGPGNSGRYGGANLRTAVKFPTPLVGGTGATTHNQISGRFRAAMSKAMEKFPTPTKSDYKGSGQSMMRSDGKMRGDRLDYATEKTPDGQSTGGQLSPDWVAWLMGWPLLWDNLQPMQTGTFAAWQKAFRQGLTG